MKRIGGFLIESSFNLTGRGLVLQGQIVDGFVRNGAKLSFTLENDTIILKVISVGIVDVNISKQITAVGLVISSQEFESLQINPKELKGKQADILD